MTLGRIDAVETAVLRKRLQRNEALKRRYTSPSCSSGDTSSQPSIAAANAESIDTNNCNTVVIDTNNCNTESIDTNNCFSTAQYRL